MNKECTFFSVRLEFALHIKDDEIHTAYMAETISYRASCVDRNTTLYMVTVVCERKKLLIEERLRPQFHMGSKRVILVLKCMYHMGV